MQNTTQDAGAQQKTQHVLHRTQQRAWTIRCHTVHRGTPEEVKSAAQGTAQEVQNTTQGIGAQRRRWKVPHSTQGHSTGCAENYTGAQRRRWKVVHRDTAQEVQNTTQGTGAQHRRWKGPHRTQGRQKRRRVPHRTQRYSTEDAEYHTRCRGIAEDIACATQDTVEGVDYAVSHRGTPEELESVAQDTGAQQMRCRVPHRSKVLRSRGEACHTESMGVGGSGCATQDTGTSTGVESEAQDTRAQQRRWRGPHRAEGHDTGGTECHTRHRGTVENVACAAQEKAD
ncbi:hypothetical protein NDU88_004582 [Pleurodeles waltl]|uniref:Uncharacterized protein n=1 Tax=Pleurodeles waltl TaxID=8319 RepID=A0AAV7V3E4_PLEWA|nr:hypothetical protein NDU88_004582 [Pleurodeles waltl]